MPFRSDPGLGGASWAAMMRPYGEFRGGLRHLYLMSRIADDDDGTRVGIRHIEDVFVTVHV